MSQPTPTEAKLLAAIAERDERLAAQEIRIHLLEQKIDALVRRLFGAKSEKLDPAQLLLLLGGIDSPGKPGEPAGEAKPLRCSEKEPTSQKREPRKQRLPDHLPVVEEIIEPEAVKAAPAQWRQIGHEVSERLDYEPARFYRLRTVRPKYVKRHDADATPVIAPLPAVLQERGSVGPGLLAQVVVGKYCDHLPLYRQADIYWRRHGVWLPRQTLSDWIDLAAQWLKPVYELIRQKILASGCVQVDETPIRYLEAGNGKCRQGYLWACAKPKGDVAFHWQTSRAADSLDTILPVDFNGIVQCDGYQAYSAMARERKGNVQLGSCMAHVRRKIVEAQAQAPKVAGWLLHQIQHLYRIESALRKNRAGPALRQANRSSQSRPILERLRKAFVRLEIRRRYLPQSAMGKAIQYALGQWEGFDVFVRDGRVELDNNHVENAIRPTAVGKRNWLFVGNAEAGERSAILYTVIEACRRRGIDPYGYLRDVFARLPTMTNWQLEAILPSNWAKARRSEIAERAA